MTEERRPWLGDMDPDEDYEVEPLRQTLWDIYTILGYDTDGDEGPDGHLNLRKVVLDAAREFRADYDDAIAETAEPVFHFVTARGQLNKRTDCCGVPLNELAQHDTTTRSAAMSNCLGMLRSNHPAAGGPRERS